MDLEDLLDGAVNIVLAGRLAVEDFDGERPAGDCEFWRAAVEVGKLGGGDGEVSGEISVRLRR